MGYGAGPHLAATGAGVAGAVAFGSGLLVVGAIALMFGGLLANRKLRPAE